MPEEKPPSIPLLLIHDDIAEIAINGAMRA